MAKVNKELLASIVAGTVKHVSQADGLPLLKHTPALIEVNPSMLDANGNAACRATQAGVDLVGGAKPTANSKYALITNAVLPPAKKRGNLSGAGAPTKYPFADMPVGASFFSANSEHKKGDAVKALGSTVSSQNDKYSEPTGVMRTVTRAVRDKKTHKAILNADGSKQMETVQLPEKSYTRKFTIRPVTAGVEYGGWVAPEDGALIQRTV
jgi:hypothetical protein